MFSKLLKHEFKQQGGLLTILSCAALGAGLLGGVAVWLLMRTIAERPDSEAAAIGAIFAMLFAMGMMFVVIAYSVGMVILLVYRFYKRHFSDEGYLTFTLPATTHQILLSSIAHIAIWSLITVIVAAIAFVSIFFQMMNVAFTAAELPVDYIWQEIRMAFESQFGVGHLILQVISVIATAVYSLILPLLAITIGSVAVKKYKLLASFGIYYGINMLLSMGTNLLSFATAVGDIFAYEATGRLSMYFTLSVNSLLYLGIGIGGYFIMHALVDKKLNLP